MTTAVPEAESTEIKDPASSELPTQDEFVKEYFLHVHPILPLLHEGDFWEAYDQGFGISPLLLHAMMFVGSTVGCLVSVQLLGYFNSLVCFTGDHSGFRLPRHKDSQEGILQQSQGT